MFEQEVELEKHQSSVLPLLLIVTLVLAVVGLAGYHLRESRKVLTVPDAANAVIDVLKAQGPATIRFHTGVLVSSVADKPTEPHYRLLEKVGILKMGHGIPYGRPVPVALTPKGEQLLSQISGIQKTKDPDGTEAYIVPLAERRLVDVSRIQMVRAGRANVEFTWMWDPNPLGENFDAASPTVKSFTTWDKASLIDKYSVQFYHQEPTKVVIALVKTDKGWKPAID